MWCGGVATALIIGAATTFGSGLGDKLFSAAATARDNSRPPVITDAMYMQQSLGDFLVSFPSPEDFAASRGFTTFQNYVGEITKLGGAIVSPNYVQISLRGNIPGSAEVSDMRVIKQCKAPLKYESAAFQGLQVVSGISFDLDDVFPVAETDDLGTPSGGFFAKHTISLADGETQTLLVALTTRHYFCQFTFQLVVDTPTGATVTENVTDNGKPFAVTAPVLP